MSNEFKCVFRPDKELPFLNIEIKDYRFIVPNEFSEQRNELYSFFGFGQIQNNDLILSPFDTFFLVGICETARISKDSKQLWDYLCSLFAPDVFPIKFAVYLFYRLNSWIVKDGSLYGGDFLLYEDHPELVHSGYLVKIITDWNTLDQELCQNTRIAYSTHKDTIIVCVSNPKNVLLNDPSCLHDLKLEAIQANSIKLR